MRSSRHERSKPLKQPRLTARDIELFLALQTHHVLPSHYLYEFTKHLGKDKAGFQKRLRNLWREGYLDRPALLNNPLVFTDYLVYALTDKSRAFLKALGKLNTYALPPSGGYRHAFMTCVLTANADLWAR